MTLFIARVQNAFISGINHAIAEKMALGDQAPPWLGNNIRMGLDDLRHIGLGRELEEMKGPIRLLAVREQLQVQPVPALEITDYLRDHGQRIAGLMYALHHSIPLHDAQVVLGGITVFSDDFKMSALLARAAGESAARSVAIIDVRTGLNIRDFARDIREATALWAECATNVSQIDAGLMPTERARIATRIITDLLKDPLIKNVGFPERVEVFQQRYPQEFPPALVGRYHEQLGSLKDAVNVLIRDMIPLRWYARLDEQSREALWSFFWKEVNVHADNEEREALASQLPDNDRKPDSLRRSNTYPQDAILLHDLKDFAQGRAKLSWINLWGYGWNPLRWKR